MASLYSEACSARTQISYKPAKSSSKKNEISTRSYNLSSQFPIEIYDRARLLQVSAHHVLKIFFIALIMSDSYLQQKIRWCRGYNSTANSRISPWMSFVDVSANYALVPIKTFEQFKIGPSHGTTTADA